MHRDALLSTTGNDALAELRDEQERVDLSLRYMFGLRVDI